MEREKMVCVIHVAKRLNCSRQHVYRLIQDGRLDAVRIGATRGLRVPQGALDRFVSERQVDTQAYDA